MAAPEEGAAPLMYQTVALKVSIHCEGCKKKVKKVLQSIEGVYKTDVDIPQHKVVVVGNVSVDALVKKLVKTGKHAEPWPEPAPPPSEANTPGGEGGGGGSSGKKKKKKKNKNKPAGPGPQGNAPAEGGGGGSGDGSIPPENPDNGGTCDEASGDEQPQKLEGGGGGGPHMAAPVVMTPHSVQPMAPPTANVNAAGGGGKKKKKSKGGGNGNGNANANGDGAGATAEMNPQDPPMNPAAGNAAVDAGSYPPAAAMSYPPGYYSGGGQVAPPYAMSYSTAHPLRSSAYYHPMVGAMYTGGSGYFHSTAPASAAPGSYYMFSEENANACRVM